MDATQQRKTREGLRRRMQREAAARTCPRCHRKYATTRVNLDAFTAAIICRWCKYEKPISR